MAFRPRLAAAVSAALAVQLSLAAGALAGPWALVPAAVPTAALAANAAPPAPAPAVPHAPAAGPAARQGPVRLSAPELWAGAVPVEPLHVDRTGALQVPATAEAMGWWADGPRPGEAGAAVVVGHVDLNGRPGVFARLARAEPGNVVTVVKSDGAQVRYRVVSVAQYAKRRFPGDAVYQPVAGAELRLITCGGRFDPRTGHYEDNVVVHAVRA